MHFVNTDQKSRTVPTNTGNLAAPSAHSHSSGLITGKVLHF